MLLRKHLKLYYTLQRKIIKFAGYKNKLYFFYEKSGIGSYKNSFYFLNNESDYDVYDYLSYFNV